MKSIPVGIDNFRKLRLQDELYVDKSLFISEVLRSSEVLLLPRPRRFGKTLNMTMLQAFFDRAQDSRVLFEGLAISRDAQAMAHLNGYPTIFFSLKSVNNESCPTNEALLKELIARLFRAHRDTLNHLTLDQEESSFLESVFDRTFPLGPLVGALNRLIEWLYRASGKKVMVLIDEYDTPIHHGHTHGFYPQIISFMRGFLGEALKGNPYLERAVITGILRVAKESIYSGLNNLSVHSLLSPKFAAYFGFTEAEVKALLIETKSPHPLEAVQAWYNGYRFGEETIYNPWSILKVLEAGGAPLQNYWIGTSGNELIADLIKSRTAIKGHQLETLLRGQSLKGLVEDSVTMIDITPQSIWTLLLFSGYLTSQSYDPQTGIAELRLPNLEVRSFFESRVKLWLGDPDLVFELIDHLLALRLKEFGEQLGQSIKTILSFHDVGGKEQEKSYHLLMVGLLASLHDRYEVLSNRESGRGRYDLALIPRQSQSQLPGLIFEFKQADAKSLAAAAESALTQIGERDYAQALRQRGLAKSAWIGLAFCGKDVALASTIHIGDQPSEVVHYITPNQFPAKASPEIPAPLPNQPTSPEPGKGTRAQRLQLLQQKRNIPVAPLGLLLSLDSQELEDMIEALLAE